MDARDRARRSLPVPGSRDTHDIDRGRRDPVHGGRQRSDVGLFLFRPAVSPTLLGIVAFRAGGIGSARIASREGQLYASKTECDSAGEAGQLAAIGAYGREFFWWYKGEWAKDWTIYKVRDIGCESTGPPW